MPSLAQAATTVNFNDLIGPADGLAGIAKDAGLPGLAAADVGDALAQIARGADRARPPVVLIAGSLYLAGEVLAANGYLPS